MRFAAVGDTATFIAVTEIVLELGDELGVVAAATLDATLTTLGFTMRARWWLEQKATCDLRCTLAAGDRRGSSN